MHTVLQEGASSSSLRTYGWRQALGQYQAGLSADFALLRSARAKYLQDDIDPRGWSREVVKRIGLQMMVAIRTMHLLRDAGFRPGAQVASRLIRYVYGAEVHWESRWDPGVNIVHGNGLVVGAGSHIQSGCLLLHNVTLGDAYDATTGAIGGPTLGPHVHVGPNSCLLGPIHVGEHSKIMAGSVVVESVPARSLVQPAKVAVVPRAG